MLLLHVGRTEFLQERFWFKSYLDLLALIWLQRWVMKMALWSFMTPTQSYLSHVDTRRHKHATTHPSCLSRSLPLPLFPYVLFLAQKHPHTHWTERKKRWVMRAFGSPFCHHGDTKVPPTGCVTSKECPSFPPSLYLPPSSLFLSHPWLRWWWDTLSLGTNRERA